MRRRAHVEEHHQIFPLRAKLKCCDKKRILSTHAHASTLHSSLFWFLPTLMENDLGMPQSSKILRPM